MEQDEDKQHRDRGDRGARHLVGEVRIEILHQRRDSDHKRFALLVLADDQLPQIVVPYLNEVQDEQRSDAGLDDRQHDLQECSDFSGPVNPCRFPQRIRRRVEKSFEKEDAESRRHVGPDHAVHAVDETQILGDPEQRHDHHFLRNHQAGDEDDKEDAAPLEPKLGKGVGRHGARDDEQRRRQSGHVQAVQRPAQSRLIGEHIGVVGPGKRARPPVRRHLDDIGAVLDRAAEQPVQREQIQQGEEKHDRVAGDIE